MGVAGTMDLITVLEIAGNPDDILAAAAGPDKKTGKFFGWITKGPGHNFKLLFSTGPMFTNKKQAIECMKEMICFMNTGNENDFKKAESWPIFKHFPKDIQEKMLDAQKNRSHAT